MRKKILHSTCDLSDTQNVFRLAISKFKLHRKPLKLMEAAVIIRHICDLHAPIIVKSCPKCLYSHVGVLERGSHWIEREPGGRFHWRVGEIQLQGFTFTWQNKKRNTSRFPQHAHHTVGSTSWCKQGVHT